ncbi:hypothetical protein NG744_09280 [Aliarcobacter cryaerophilus]|uniref:hypothetical protein n=1 Tax=Aliarcobacter cryaerophilus TaxID=28198 RepID=UPI003DA45662
MIKIVKMIATTLAIIYLFSGCTTKIPMKDITTSKEKFEISNEENQIELNFVDDSKNGKVTEGKFEKVLFLEYQNKDINGYEFISNNLKKEIEARNLPIKLVKNEATNNNLLLNSFKINSQQTTGFTPLTTFTKAKLTLEKDNEKYKIVSVIKRAKMLMFSVIESYEPCYYEPTSVVVQEIVAKLNIALFNYKLDDNSVKELISVANKQIKNKDNSAYLTVYKLGFSNNPLALDFIYEHTKHTYPDYVRFSSISTLGMLGGEKYINYLISIYNNPSYSWEDKIIALKSIGDINSSEGNNFLEKTYKELGDKKDFHIKAQKDTIELYIK